LASQRKKGALLSYLFMALEILTGMVFTPFLIRSFGQAEYGIYSLVGSITAYLYLFDLGIGNSIIRYMSKYRVHNDREKQQSLMALTMCFYLGVGALVILVGMILQTNLHTIFGTGLNDSELARAKAMFIITILNAAVTLMLAPFSKTVLAFERFTFSKISDIIKIILRVSISILVLLLGGKGIAIVVVNFSMTLLFGMISIIYHALKIKIKPVFSKIEKSFVKEIFSYSTIIFVQMLATQLNSMVDQVLLGIMVKSSAVIIGVYAIGTHLSTYIQSFAVNITGLLMPGVVRMVETVDNKKDIENEMIRISRIIFMMLGIIYVIFVVFGDDFIKLWAGDENYQAYYVGMIIMLPMVFSLSQSIGTQILWAMNKHKIQAVLQIVVALSNILLSAIMIKWNPLVGASLATCITYFIGNVVVQNIVYTKYIGISMLRFYKGLFSGTIPALLISLIVGLGVQIFKLSGWGGFVVNCGSMFATYLIVMYFKGMTAYERNLVDSLVRKLKRR